MRKPPTGRGARTVLTAVAAAGALGLAACGGGGAASEGADAGPAPSVTAAASSAAPAAGAAVDWQQVHDLFGPDFRQRCTGPGGAEPGRCVETLARRSQALLDVIDGLPKAGVVPALERDAQDILDKAQAFRTQSCRSSASGGCGAAAEAVTTDAQAISEALREAAG